MAVWAMKHQQVRRCVGMGCCRDLLSVVLLAGFLQAAQPQALLWGNIWDLFLACHLPLCTCFMVANMVGEHKTRGKGGSPSVACTTNSGSKVLILEWKMKSKGRVFLVKQEILWILLVMVLWFPAISFSTNAVTNPYYIPEKAVGKGSYEYTDCFLKNTCCSGWKMHDFHLNSESSSVISEAFAPSFPPSFLL